MSISSRIRFYKKIKQFSKERNVEKILQDDWSGYPEFQLFCQDLNLILEGLPEEQLQQKQAEYLALQNQINPHFLYNTLEAIRADALVAGCGNIADTTEALATFFRYTITDVQHFVTLSDELDNVDNYFIIQKFRFGDKLEMNQELENEELMSARMPKLLLQPLVENAISHGLECKVGEGTVTIAVENSEKTLFISVKDDGVGMDEEKVEKLNHIFSSQDKTRKHYGELKKEKGGIALPNVNSRIKLLFGEDYGLHIYSVEGVGTEIRMTLPLIMEIE
ncbi:MAG: sensor histidine kinase [Clostridia bacterium]|nr:sensor histidine kinase [Clostridia bacterium]NCC42806.1 sensor histidine kinase [Clostridia bacterium]